MKNLLIAFLLKVSVFTSPILCQAIIDTLQTDYGFIEQKVYTIILRKHFLKVDLLNTFPQSEIFIKNDRIFHSSEHKIVLISKPIPAPILNYRTIDLNYLVDEKSPDVFDNMTISVRRSFGGVQWSSWGVFDDDAHRYAKDGSVIIPHSRKDMIANVEMGDFIQIKIVSYPKNINKVILDKIELIYYEKK